MNARTAAFKAKCGLPLTAGNEDAAAFDKDGYGPSAAKDTNAMGAGPQRHAAVHRPRVLWSPADSVVTQVELSAMVAFADYALDKDGKVATHMKAFAVRVLVGGTRGTPGRDSAAACCLAAQACAPQILLDDYSKIK